MATAAVRTLPLRVASVAGEAIDSWLEATAHRCHVTWADLRATLGSVLPSSGHPDEWVGRLTDVQCNVISAATACDHLSWPQLGRCSSRILAPPGR